jgi:hypothetical protein
MICGAESTPRPGTSAKRCEQLRHLLIELGQVVFDRPQFIERQLHQPPIHRMQIRARPEGVAQLLGRGPQSLIGECGHRRRIPFTVADPRSASSRLCSCTRLRVIWYLRRITVRHSRCSPRSARSSRPADRSSNTERRHAEPP